MQIFVCFLCFLLVLFSEILLHILIFFCHRPLHLCVATWNVAVVKKWVEVASVEEIEDAIDVPSPDGTALCMAAAAKKDHETGN